MKGKMCDGEKSESVMTVSNVDDKTEKQLNIVKDANDSKWKGFSHVFIKSK